MNPQTHVFAIAIESYQAPEFPKVIYAESDAQSFADAWTSLGARENVVTLFGAQATKSAFRSKLKRFAQNIAAGDLVVFYYSGHGVSEGGESFLTTYDTLSDDVGETSAEIGDVLKLLTQTAGSRVVVFLDLAHGNLPVAGAFSLSTVSSFGAAADSFATFVSASALESSGRSLQLRQGIWSHGVTSALSGQVKEAATPKGTITSASLQAYLATEVPRLARANAADSGGQNPLAFGDVNEGFEIADLGTVSQKAPSGPSINGARLVGGSRGRVKSLSGFTKFVKEPDSCTSRSAQFVESLGVKEVEDRATEIFDRVREVFKYKRRELFFDKEGAIKTPDFDVLVRLTQDPVTPNMYLLTNEVTVQRRPEVISEPAFTEVFARYCNSVVLDLGGSLDIEAKIDDIEDVDSLRAHLEYDAECTEFTLRFPGTGIVLHATRDRLQFTLSGGGDLVTLIHSAQSALAHLSGSRISLGLPDRTP